MENGHVCVLTPKREIISDNWIFWSADDHNLTEYDIKKAYRELNETEEIQNTCLWKLKGKLSDDEKIRYRTDDEYLLRFLRVGKFNIDKAYQKLQDFYSVRRKHPEYFKLPTNLESLLNMDFYTRLPYLDQEGRIIFTLNMEKLNPAQVSLFDLMTFMIIVSDISSINPKSQINGIVGIWDMKGLSASHFTHYLNPGRIRTGFKILQGCYPWRLKAIIGINCGILAGTCYKLLKPFLKTKMTQRMFLMGSDMKELHQLVNPAVLPKRFGGELEESECNFAQHVLDNIPYLKYERSFGEKNNNVKC